MDKRIQAFAEEYIEIENNPRNHRTRGQLVTQLLARYPDIEQASFQELLPLLDQLKHSQATIRMPLFAGLVYPVLEREIELENPQAMLILLQHLDLLHKYAIQQKRQQRYTERALIKRYVSHVPDDRTMLLRLSALLSRDLEYAVHELPTGVLNGINGATPDGCLELLDLLEEYVSTCQRLGIDCSADSRYYAMHFQGYRDYLLHRELYDNYSDYIHQHHLALR